MLSEAHGDRQDHGDHLLLVASSPFILHRAHEQKPLIIVKQMLCIPANEMMLTGKIEGMFKVSVTALVSLRH